MSKKTIEERILQLTNDHAEGMRTGTAAEWRQVADYWRDQCEVLVRSRNRIRDAVTMLALDILEK